MLPSRSVHCDRFLSNPNHTTGHSVRAKVGLGPRLEHGVLPGGPGVRRRHGRRVGARVAAAPLRPERGALAVGVAVAYDVPEGGSGTSSLVRGHFILGGCSDVGWCVSVWAGPEMR